MSEEFIPNQEQAQRWNEVSGPTWVDLRELLDGLLAPFATLLIEAVAPAEGDRLLDAGCGTGAVTLAAARRAGPGGGCLGVDISAPMIEAAKARARDEGVSAAEFISADAQSHPFGAGKFDAIVSRFGVMFFENPVAAFRNLRTAARAGGRLAFIAWRSADENAFMTTAERAAASLLPELPARDEQAPGQFAFGDGERVRSLLEASGWADVSIRPIDVACAMPRRDFGTYVTRMGPLGAVFPTLPQNVRTEFARRLEAAFQPYVHGKEVRFTAACWEVTATT
ncbi:class I SAM-dependent methyltransferase [Sphingosinicella humi]|uniref:SAM-dependent methyltransferase n=1 Tax=Allosphingosinicella humi TaxID=2068657 RepID=A0A2U2J1M3_9SPHN|nr:class I SAM-dependent methyltransferase [Sphingosinicella humi]PWG02240.1 SAM-dependent methyltransferase [Sphingosinicella humi]